MKIQSRIARLVLVLISSVMAHAAIAEPTVIYLTRHAEKEATGSDPALTAAGQVRAQNLAAILKKTGVKAVYSTAVLRTRQTATPLATALSLPIQNYDAMQLAAFAQQLKTSNQTAYVAGHSDTTPELIRQFGGNPGSAIDENEFDRLYQVIIANDGSVTTVLLTSLPTSTTCNSVSLNRPNLSGALNSWTYFTIDVPECSNTLTVNISGGSGDADLYVRFGAQPTTSTFACAPYKSGNTESCPLPNPQAGTWHIGIKAFKAFSGVTLNATAVP